MWWGTIFLWMLLTATAVESPEKDFFPTWAWEHLFSAALATSSKDGRMVIVMIIMIMIINIY